MRRRSFLAGSAGALVLAACGGGGQDADVGEPQDWDGAVALTGAEDSPLGVVATDDGSTVLFTTGRNQVGENAIRSVAVGGSAGGGAAGGGASVVVRAGSEDLVPSEALAVDATHVYAGYGLDLVRVPLAGGDPEVLAPGRPAGILRIALHDGFAYWTTYQFNGTAGQIELARVPVGGGDVEQLAVDVADQLGLPQFDGDAVLLSSPDGVQRVVPGSPAEVLVPSDPLGGAVTDLAFDAESFYVLVAGPRLGLLSVPRAGGDPRTYDVDIDTSAELLLVGDQLVGFSGGGLGRPSRLVAVDTASGESRTLATGRFPGRDLAEVPGHGVAFTADSRVWLVSL